MPSGAVAAQAVLWQILGEVDCAPVEPDRRRVRGGLARHEVCVYWDIPGSPHRLAQPETGGTHRD
jgi:hypothetical protein